MSDDDDGGHAFPVPLGCPGGLRGMSLRDWFAGQALVGMLARYGGVCEPGEVAWMAHKVADAMIEERK